MQNAREWQSSQSKVHGLIFRMKTQQRLLEDSAPQNLAGPARVLEHWSPPQKWREARPDHYFRRRKSP